MTDQILFSSVNLDQLKAEISEAVNLAVNPLKANNPPKAELVLLTRKEAAKLLGVSLPTLLEWTKKGKVQGYRIASRVRYKRNEIESALQKINLHN
jgi:excisionase family DNA binding protein